MYSKNIFCFSMYFAVMFHSSCFRTQYLFIFFFVNIPFDLTLFVILLLIFFIISMLIFAQLSAFNIIYSSRVQYFTTFNTDTLVFICWERYFVLLHFCVCIIYWPHLFFFASQYVYVCSRERSATIYGVGALAKKALVISFLPICCQFYIWHATTITTPITTWLRSAASCVQTVAIQFSCYAECTVADVFVVVVAVFQIAYRSDCKSPACDL